MEQFREAGAGQLIVGRQSVTLQPGGAALPERGRCRLGRDLDLCLEKFSANVPRNAEIGALKNASGVLEGTCNVCASDRKYSSSMPI